MLHRGTMPLKMTMCFTTPMMSGSKIYRPPPPPPPPPPSHAEGNYPPHPFPSITPSFQLLTFASHLRGLIGILVQRLVEVGRSLQKCQKVLRVQLGGGAGAFATLPLQLKSHPRSFLQTFFFLFSFFNLNHMSVPWM